MKRVLLYCRVSTDEQAKKELSIPTQKRILEDYANNKGYIIVNTYVDNGISAKSIKKRDALINLLHHVQHDNIDIVLFTRLDRFTRIGKDYYYLNDILEKNNCRWDAILEDYDTTTANGQLMLEIKLAVNHNELMRTSERIKDVFNNKVNNGTWLTGSKPFYFDLTDDKRLVLNDKAHIMKDAIDKYMINRSKKQTADYIREKYNMPIYYDNLRIQFKNTLLYGAYRDNENFCEPLISKQQWLLMQSFNHDNKKRVSNRIFIFTGVLKCSHCNKSLIPMCSVRKNKNGTVKEYMYYRCENHYKYKKCDFNHQVPEHKIESLLLDNVANEFDKYTIEYELKTKTKSNDNQIKAIHNKIERLKDLYIDGVIDKDRFNNDYKALNLQLEDLKDNAPITNVDYLKKLLNNDFKAIYDTFDRNQKRTFWQSCIKKASFDDALKNIDISF